MGESDYSFSLTTFSPSGRLVQIDYALQAVSAGATALGIKGKFIAHAKRQIMAIRFESATSSCRTQSC